MKYSSREILLSQRKCRQSGPAPLSTITVDFGGFGCKDDETMMASLSLSSFLRAMTASA